MSSARLRELGQLSPEHTVLMVCDLQEKFAPSIARFWAIVNNAERLIKVARLLEVPVIATEQYPKGLGPTVPHLSRHFSQTPAAKTKFTMLVPEVLAQLKELTAKVDTVVLCGIETHVCILATCQDLRAEGFNVHVVADAVSSRTQTDRQLALERMQRIGAYANTTESVALSLVGDAAHPKFKEVQMLIKDLAFDTGLVRSERALKSADPGRDDV